MSDFDFQRLFRTTWQRHGSSRSHSGESEGSFALMARKVAHVVAVVVFYSLVSVVTTWPLLNYLDTHLTDRFGDAFLHLWNSWWVEKALAAGQSPLYTNYLFYPEGVNLLTHNIAWFHVAPSLFFGLFFNRITAYNLAVLLNLVMCGCFAFWLAWRLTGSVPAALIAGLIYQTWPYRLVRLDLPNLLATQWIPVFLLFLTLTMRNGRWRDAILAGIAFALVGYTRWQHLIPTTIMGLIYFVVAVLFLHSINRRQMLTRLFLAAGMAGLLVLPPILLLFSEIQGSDDSASLIYEGEEILLSTDVLAFVTPSEDHPLWGEWTKPLYQQYYSDRVRESRRRPAYIGVVAIALAIGGIYTNRRQTLPWIVMAISLVFLALGPVLRLNGQLYENVPTLYGVLSLFDIVRLIRNPERFTMFLALPIAVMAAYGVAGWLARLPQQRPSRVIPAVLSILILFDYFAPQTVFQDVSNFPAIDTQIAQESGEFAILNLPFDHLKGSIYMLEQIQHQRPILQGNLSRVPGYAYHFIDTIPFLSTLRHYQEVVPELSDVSQQLGVLADNNIGYIFMHKNLVGADRVQHWQRYLLIEPRYEDERLAVYTTSPEARLDFELQATLRPGLGYLDFLVSADCLQPGRTLEVDIGWGTYQALTSNYALSLSLMSDDGQSYQMGLFPLVEGWPTAGWPAGAIAWGYYKVELPPSLPIGSYTLVLRLLDADTGGSVSQDHPLRTLTVQEERCEFVAEAEAAAADVLYGNELHLVAYQAQITETEVDLTLYWRSEQRTDRDYTVFVHVFDPVTGVPIAQTDTRPHAGAYPTQFWWPGEMVDDRLLVSLAGVPAGKYGIAIGVYELASGERLPGYDSQGELLADYGRFILPETVTIR